MNKFIIVALFLTGSVFSVCFAQQHPYQIKSVPVPQRVKDVLSCMTLEEKIVELKRFASIYLQPGEEKEVRFMIPPVDFSIYNHKMEKFLETGSFIIGVGPDSSHLNQTKIYFL